MKPLIQTRLKETPKYIFIDKTVFFLEEGILVIGDLHIGYETMLKAFGLQIPLNLTKEIIEDLKRIFSEIKSKKYEVNKVIFLGDIKHIFSPEYQEKKEFFQVLNLIEKHVKSKNDIILIKGNHDTFDFSGIKMRNYYINNDIAFLHGHKDFKQVYNKKIKYVVIGHIHPSIRLSDKAKSEKFKCFLVGNYKNKQFIILPSFFNVIEGTDVNDYQDSHSYQDHFSIIPRKSLLNFNVYVVGENNKIYDFWKVKRL